MPVWDCAVRWLLNPTSIWLACCAVGGQGAGIAAALSLRQSCALSDLPVAEIQAELVRQGGRWQ